MVEKRRQPRHRLRVPVQFEDALGLTTDLSGSGIRFESTRPLDAGSAITFSLKLGSTGTEGLLHCGGQVVRVETFEERAFIAATIDEIQFGYELR